MAFKFSCPNCQRDVLVRDLKAGDEAMCKGCGAVTAVPEMAEEVDDPVAPAESPGGPDEDREQLQSLPMSGEPNADASQSIHPQVSFSGKRAWNPTAIFWLAALFAILPGGIMWSLNWERFGRPEKKVGSLVLVICLSSALFLAAAFIQKIPPIAFLVMGVAAARYFRKTQEDLFESFMLRGGSKARIRIPLTICLVVTGLQICVMLFGPGGIYASSGYDDKYEAAVNLALADKYTEAVESFKGLEEDYPDEPAAYYSLACVYGQQGHIDSALAQITLFLELAPDDSAGLEFRRELRFQADSIAHARSPI